MRCIKHCSQFLLPVWAKSKALLCCGQLSSHLHLHQSKRKAVRAGGVGRGQHGGWGALSSPPPSPTSPPGGVWEEWGQAVSLRNMRAHLWIRSCWHSGRGKRERQDGAAENKINMHSRQTGLAGLFPCRALPRSGLGRQRSCSRQERHAELTASSHRAHTFPGSPHPCWASPLPQQLTPCRAQAALLSLSGGGAQSLLACGTKGAGLSSPVSPWDQSPCKCSQACRAQGHCPCVPAAVSAWVPLCHLGLNGPQRLSSRH